jgi:hypothetical protein
MSLYSYRYLDTLKPDDWEGMMPITASLHTDHQLDQLAGQFEHWRQTRTHPGECIPEPLWQQAVALTTLLPYTRVAKHLRLAPSDLKKRKAAQADSSAAGPALAGFVEVTTVAPNPTAPVVNLELERPDGTRLRLPCPDSNASLAAVVRAFVEA